MDPEIAAMLNAQPEQPEEEAAVAEPPKKRRGATAEVLARARAASAKSRAEKKKKIQLSWNSSQLPALASKITCGQQLEELY